jgi:glycosyltransferase involved in cell wall biosynthesis
MWNARFAGRLAGRLGEPLLRAIERVACALADRVITVHEPYRAELASYGVARPKIDVVMNAVDATVLARVPGRPSNARTTDVFRVAYHGTITDWYGVDILVQAIAHAVNVIPNLEVVILGEGDALPGVRSLAARLGVDQRIQFSGRYLPVEEALAEVALADCGVVPNPPSLLSNFLLPNKLLEYVALEVPVVATRLLTVASHFGDDEVTFVRPGDPVSLASGLRWIAENPREAALKAHRARARAEAYSRKMPASTALTPGPALLVMVIETWPLAATEIGTVTHAPWLKSVVRLTVRGPEPSSTVIDSRRPSALPSSA